MSVKPGIINAIHAKDSIQKTDRMDSMSDPGITDKRIILETAIDRFL